MPLLSLGFMRSMHQWQDLPLVEIPKRNQDNMRAIVETALQYGINHFETAHAYGSSERQLGEILSDIPREKFILQTKVQPTANPSDFIRKVHDSLNHLNQDRVDLLAIHGINTYEDLWYTCRDNGCLAAARTLQKEGKIGYIGFSSHGSTNVILEAVRHEKDGGFDYLNLHWYYIFQVHLQAIREANQRDMGVFIISPTDKGGMLNTPSAQMKEMCAPLSPILYNDLFCLSRPEVQTISIGASSRLDFEEHIKVLDLLTDPEENIRLKEIDERLKNRMRDKTGHDRPDWMWHNLPEWNRTPGYINIQMILWLYNLAQGWGLIDYARRRYQQLGHDMPWVPGCNASALALYDFSRALKTSPVTAEKIIPLLQQAHELLGKSPDS